MNIVYKVHIRDRVSGNIKRSFYGGSKENAERLKRNIEVNLDNVTNYVDFETYER